MNKIAEILSNIDGYLGKEAFIPNPATQQKQQGQDMLGQLMQAVQQMPPEVQQQIAPQLQQIQQLPPDQQQAAVQQLMQALQGGGDQGGDPSQQPQDPSQQGQPAQQDPSQAAAPGSPEAGGGGVGGDIYSTKVTMTVKDLLDLVSGGKASMTHAKIKQVADKHQLHTEKMKSDMAAQKQQQTQDQMLAQQQAAAASAPGANLNQGGVYPTPPQQ